MCHSGVCHSGVGVSCRVGCVIVGRGCVMQG